MARFCVNTNPQSTGEHEVHNLDAVCQYLPDSSNRRDIGAHASCHGAVAKAKTLFPKVDGCYHCSRPCHTR